MNKKEIVKLVESLNFPKEEFYILSSGCLTLYGIREEANDLDLCITQKLFNLIKDKYSLDENKKNHCGFYSLSDHVEVVVNSREEFENQFDIKDGYQVQKLEIIRDFKIERGLPKDIKDIKKINEYLENNK